LISVSRAPDPFRLSTTAFPGTWNPGGDPVRVLNGFLPGDILSLQVRVWDIHVGGGWEEAAMGFGQTQHGVSAIFSYTIPPSAGGPQTAYYMDNLRGFMLVPEPSVIALAMIGAGGLLLLRRRK